MSEKDIRFDNIVKAWYPPFLYVMITIMVEAVGNLYLFIRQTGDVRQAMGSFSSSYHFFENLDNKMEQYAYLVVMVAAILGVLIFGVLFLRDCSVNQDFLTAYRWKGVRIKEVLMVMGLGFFAGTGLSRFVCLLPLDNVIGSYENVSEQLLRGNLGIQILLLGVLVPAAEELIYRGLVFLRMKKIMEIFTAAVTASLLFGIFHFNLLQGMYAFLLSMVLIVVLLKYHSLLPCILLHGVANTTAVISEYYHISEHININLFMYVFVMLLELFLTGAFLFYMMPGADKTDQKLRKNTGNL